MAKKPAPKHAADYDLWAREHATATPAAPPSAFPEGTFRVTDERAKLWEPAGPVQCSACGSCDWWRGSHDGGWQCRPCNPAPAGMDREAFRLAFRSDERAIDRASNAGGDWLCATQLASVPMMDWPVKDWRTFVETMCESYVKP